MNSTDMETGAKVLVGDQNWRKGPFWPAFWAYFLGQRETFIHLDVRCTVAWHKGQPYLLSIRAAKP